MQIDISELEQGRNRLRLKGDAEGLELDGTDTKLKTQVLVELTLDVFEENVRIDGVVRAEAEEECSRCLNAFRRKIEAELHLYAAGKSQAGKSRAGKSQAARGSGKSSGGAGADVDADEGEDADGGYLFHDGCQLDLSDEVRSAILLSSPMKPLCSPECKGLCPVCGADMNEESCSCDARPADPRWKGLEKLHGR
jgi:uncharacterized protein